MKSYTTLRNLYGAYTLDSSSTNLLLGDQLINDGIRKITGLSAWSYLEASDTSQVTIAGVNAIPWSNNYGKDINITVAVGSYEVTLKEVASRNDWDRLNYLPYQSNYPEFFFIWAGQILIWPTPSTNGQQVTINYRQAIRDLSIPDYTTGTIITVATTGGVTTVTGSGVTWTAAMVGEYIQINQASGGDGWWYQIASVPTSSTLTLVKPYMGTAIATGSATYIIGQMPVLPEDYHILPVYYAVSQYTGKNVDAARAKMFFSLYTDGLEQMRNDFGEKSTSLVIDSGLNPNIINPNLTIQGH